MRAENIEQELLIIDYSIPVPAFGGIRAHFFTIFCLDAKKSSSQKSRRYKSWLKIMGRPAGNANSLHSDSGFRLIGRASYFLNAGFIKAVLQSAAYCNSTL